MIRMCIKDHLPMKRKIDRTLFELWLGIVVFGAICFLGVIFVPDRFSYCICLSIGILTALAASFHMWFSLNKSLELEEDAATKKARLGYLIRYFSLAVILVVTGIFFGSYVLAAFAGIIGIKVSAYLQPFTHKICNIFNQK